MYSRGEGTRKISAQCEINHRYFTLFCSGFKVLKMQGGAVAKKKKLSIDTGSVCMEVISEAVLTITLYQNV